MPPEPRWPQRFANFCQPLDQLETFVQPPALNERERQGLIKAFEYCFELGWSTLRLAFRVGLIRDGEGWLRMVQDRNLTSHTDKRATAEEVSQQVGERYLPCFQELRQVLAQRLEASAADGDHG